MRHLCKAAGQGLERFTEKREGERERASERERESERERDGERDGETERAREGERERGSRWPAGCLAWCSY